MEILLVERILARELTLHRANSPTGEWVRPAGERRGTGGVQRGDCSSSLLQELLLSQFLLSLCSWASLVMFWLLVVSVLMGWLLSCGTQDGFSLLLSLCPSRTWG